MKYVIIGNGIIALATAFRLLTKLAAKDELYIIGPQSRLGSATLAAPAMLNSFAEIDSQSLRSRANKYHFDMSIRAAELWPDFERELKVRASSYQSSKNRSHTLLGDFIQTGTYVVNNTVSDQVDDINFDAIV